MTVAELKQVISKYPDDMEVKTGNNPLLSPINDVKTVTDIDTNIRFLVLYGDKIWWFRKVGE